MSALPTTTEPAPESAPQREATVGRLDRPGVTFEGKPVSAIRLRFTGLSAPLECADRVAGVDDLVRVSIEGRVVAVDHKVDDKTGELIRVQTVKPLDMDFLPFDDSDPNDTGIIRVEP
jgi:hypothetical protein